MDRLAIGADHLDIELIENPSIGRFDGVQIRQVERTAWRRQVFVREKILRLAILPTGHLISVAYFPMTDLTLADLKLLHDEPL